MLVAPAVVLAILAALAWLRFGLLIATVSGRSMEPAYPPGAQVLALRRPRRARPGDVVLLPAPDGGTSRLVMKRVAAAAGDPVPPTEPPVPGGPVVPPGHLVLLGDRPEASTDSRLWGFVPVRAVRGRVVARLR